MRPVLKRILYVEDESDIRTVTAMALEAVGGFAVICCSSGAEALAKAPEANAELILLDVMMPGMDGLATLSALRGLPQTPDTPGSPSQPPNAPAASSLPNPAGAPRCKNEAGREQHAVPQLYRYSSALE